MCGICGAIRLRGEGAPPVDTLTLRAMTAAIVHRGPDDAGYYSDGGAAIGVRRLSIVDVERGHQPMANARGTVVVAQNGELYNHDDLRRELEEACHTFRTTCDTEVLPHLYAEHGDNAAEPLNGMFAFVVWDSERRRTVIARDRLGIKPLYYAEVGDVLLFGSELKAVLASGLVSTEIDVGAVELLLSLGFVPAPRTLLKQVKKLRSGQDRRRSAGRSRRALLALCGLGPD
jgi:asparagine synthase (glutamine-hydrolysing)